MTNYAKWDKFAAGLSDEESDGEEFSNKPVVTTFDKKGGESITIGPSGYHVTEKQTVKPVKTAVTSSSSASRVEKESSKGNVEVLSTSVPLTEHEIALESKNGAVLDKYSWSQDRFEVLLTIPVEDNVKAKNIKLSYANKVLTIKDGDSVIISEQLRYDILTNEDRKDDEVSDILDWEIKNKLKASSSSGANSNRRVLEVVLRKKSPIPGVFMWWENVFLSDSVKIDVTKISGRVNNIESLKAVNDNYVEANKQFLERIAKHEPIEVDIDDNGDNEEEEEDPAKANQENAEQN